MTIEINKFYTMIEKDPFPPGSMSATKINLANLREQKIAATQVSAGAQYAYYNLVAQVKDNYVTITTELIDEKAKTRTKSDIRIPAHGVGAMIEMLTGLKREYL